MVGDKLTFMCH